MIATLVFLAVCVRNCDALNLRSSQEPLAARVIVEKRPHIIFALVDDLGYAGVGYNSPTGEPKTPVIDALAANGVKMAKHYAYRFCGPSRSAFLSGRLPLHVTQNNCDACGPATGMTFISELLQRAGYATHHSGKWHVGHSSADHLPVNRGFNSSLAMLGGSADHYTGLRPGGPEDKFNYVDMWLNDKPAEKTEQYSTFRFLGHALKELEAHDANVPFFLFLSFQGVHYPYQVPEEYLVPYMDVEWEPRRIGLAEISLVDQSIGKLIEALKAKNMWEDTLLVFSSDNGGPTDHESNFPFRGSKGSDLEGGIRAVAFVSGPFLPQAARGREFTGLAHIADWYATFAHVAGIPWRDERAEAMGLPSVDSVDLWPMISGEEGRHKGREELVISGGPGHRWVSATLIVGPWKLIRGKISSDCYPGPTTPNSSEWWVNCNSRCDKKKGCLFNLQNDPTEREDLADINPGMRQQLFDRAVQLDATAIPGDEWFAPVPESVDVAVNLYGGVWGPWLQAVGDPAAGNPSSFAMLPLKKHRQTPQPCANPLFPDPTDVSRPGWHESRRTSKHHAHHH